jgi:uncharacterized DUF497 family protein
MFDWDEANLSHIARHGVTPEEVEQAFANDPADGGLQEEEGEQRFYQIGVTDKHRCLSLITTWRGTQIRVVTAYPATKAAERYYWQKKRRQ